MAASNLLFALANYVDIPDSGDADEEYKFASRIWSELEISTLELRADELLPSLPGLSYTIDMHAEHAVLSLAACCREFHQKFGRIRCCVCAQAFPLGQFHRLFRKSFGGERWFLHRATHTRYRVLRGEQEPQVDWREGSLQVGPCWGGPPDSFGEAPPATAPSVLYHPVGGCRVCDDRFRLHPQCHACRQGHRLPPGNRDTLESNARYKRRYCSFFRHS